MQIIYYAPFNDCKSLKIFLPMREFLESVTNISNTTSKLDEYIEGIDKCILTKQNSVLNEEEENVLDSKIECLNSTFVQQSESIKEQISKLQKETELIKSESKDKRMIEMRELNIYRLRSDLTNAIRRYQDVQCDYKNKEKSKLKEAFLIANPKATDEDLKKLSESDGEAVIASAFALGSHSAQGILNQAKNRHKKIEKIVETINTLVKLIEEIDSLVKKNSTIVNQIEVNMTAAEIHTEGANNELFAALGWEISAMRIKRIIAGVAVVIFIVFILWILRGRVGGSKNSSTN